MNGPWRSTRLLRMRYVHTNLIARDWQRLSRFYCDVFGCEIGSLRELSGGWLERGSGVPGARIVGAHLKLLGYGDGGLTLEMHATRERVIAAGGTAVESGESVDIPNTHGDLDLRPRSGR